MRFYLMLFMALGWASFAGAQTPASPVPGYTYRVDVGTAGKTVYVCGQRPFNDKGELVGAGDLNAQTQQVFENLKTALGSVGMTLRDVTQVTYHLKNATEPTGPINAQSAQAINGISAAYFTQGTPRVADFKNLPKIINDDVLLEVEVIAVK